jgi:hypothetical protein
MENTVRFKPSALFLSALLLSASLVGCKGGHSANENPFIAQTTKQKTATEPVLSVIENEPTLKGSQSVIGGSIRNVSGERLEDLFLELELTRRGDDSKQVQLIPVAPASLAPGEEGLYAITLSNRDWAGSKILRVRSGSSEEGLAFISQPGAKRPPERTPDGKIIIVRKPRTEGDDFLNSPDDADPIR